MSALHLDGFHIFSNEFSGKSEPFHVSFDLYPYRYDATDMNLFRSALSACLLADLPNMHDYLYKERNKINR
jgi:kelch-like protein 10